MKITHTTTLSNLPSIRKTNLRVSYAKQGRKAIWFHKKADDAWAENHVRIRQHADGDDLVHLDCEIPDSWVLRHSKSIFYVMRDVPFSRVRKIRVVRRVVEEIPLEG